MTGRDDRAQDELPLAGRVALVTGGARRVGRHLALALSRAGANVVIHYLSSHAEAETVLSDVSWRGAGGELIQGDLADPRIAEGLVRRAAAYFGPPDILINNASIFEEGDLEASGLEEWDAHHAVNLRAPFLLARSFAEELPEDRRGDVINLNDWRAVRPGPDHFAYTVSKAGLHGLTQSLALALAPRVRVNEIALGAVLPPELAPDEYLHTLKSEIPLRRFPDLDDVAEAMLFLLRSRAVTGQTLFVDGGRHLS